MGEVLDATQQAYEAVGRRDIPVFFILVADEERPSLPRPWKRYSRIIAKKASAATAVIGIAAIGTLSHASTEGNENRGKVAVTELAAVVQEKDKPLVFDAILKDQAACPEASCLRPDIRTFADTSWGLQGGER
jgi:hypothetical protein